MKGSLFFFTLLFFIMWGCSDQDTPLEKGIGYLTLNIQQASDLKSDMEIDDFILSIYDMKDHLLVRETIGNLPEQVTLPADRYKVTVYSMEFTDPKFDTPCFSGETEIEIAADETKEIHLTCTQINAGIKILWSNEFAEAYSTYQAEVRSGSARLVYSSVETRTGYFLPGTVTLHISADGQEMHGGSIFLNAKDMVNATLRPVATSSGALSVSLTIDETINERNLDIFPDPAGENSQDNPYNIAKAIERQGGTEVWVEGYIVGSKPSSGWEFTNSATWQASNIVLADNADETDSYKCIPVELPSSGSIRNSLNLPANPELLKKKILIRGNLLVYHSRPGLRNITAYSITN